MPTEENRTSVNVTHGVHARLHDLVLGTKAASKSQAIEYLLAIWDTADQTARAAAIGHANLHPIPERPKRIRRRGVGVAA